MIVFGERPYYLDSSTGYYRSHCRAPDREYLHRDVWRATYGNIPHGWEVHHTVEDKGTLDADDLECIPALEHCKRHAERSRAYGHANIHHTRRQQEFICEGCGKPFLGVYRRVRRWCSHACANRFHNAVRRH